MCDRVNQEQVKSNAILSPWSVPIGGEDVCILSSLAFHKVLLAAIQFTVAGSKLTINYLFSHPGFILFFLCLMWTRFSFWTENLFKNWPRINLSCSSIFCFSSKNTGQEENKPESISWLPKWIESILFLIYSFWEVVSQDNLPLVKFDLWPFLKPSAMLFPLLLDPERGSSGFFLSLRITLLTFCRWPGVSKCIQR